ncbi:50S ribosomal protein L24 [Candidatus Bathyarchaeota archaeon]|nr:50S ribosomal protein L24 [Candidatus Bathyarchaeota archaeon]MBS7627774.1 50S ribosomal protein L24 [Candidatus Bathyarchaeota archaeon]
MGFDDQSSKPRKQRLLLHKAPHHRIHRLVAAPLSQELRNLYKTRSLPVRKGDTVLIVRGDFKGISGRVLKVERKKRRIEIEGVTRERADGRVVRLGIHPSKTVITKLNLDDKWRMKILERRATTPKAEGEAEKALEVKV